ncbi:MAG: ExeM/NucH family extracellular endonuclease, partial [Burkholderiaceae bacterium]
NAVTLSGNPAGITLGALTPATAAGGTASVPIVVASSVAAGSYPLSLSWANDQGQTAVCTPTVTVGAITAIYTIQGAESTSAYAGRTVLTQGVVTRVTNNGFYMQDLLGDGDDATSDGIFVFTSTAPTVAPGNLVRVSATVAEFNTGAATNPDTASHTITELSSVGSVSVVGTGYTITPVAIAFPFASRDTLEQYEHMLVTINGPLTVNQNYFLGQYGQLTVSAQGRNETPTNRYRPGTSALALGVDNKRRSLVLEDGTSVQHPNAVPFLGDANTVRVGDTTQSITGVVDYGLVTGSNLDPGGWRIIPTVAPAFTRANARTTTPDEVGGTVKVAAANVLNFFTTFRNGQTAAGAAGQGCTVGNSTSASNCRGADNLAEFVRQRTKVVEELAAIDADAVGIVEMQNNGSVGVQALVDALNAKLGAHTYAAVPDPVEGTGTDAIKVVMIYKPARLARLGASISDPSPIHNRPPLAQSFLVPGGQQFTLIVNHLKSKGCGGATGLDADQGDLQGCFNASRVRQAAQTRAFVTSLFPAGSSPQAILVGDFNAYAQEDPIESMTANGYVDEIGRFDAFGYSYGFDSASGRLDQALTTPVLSAKVKRAIEWHIDSDEPSALDYHLDHRQPACATCSADYYTPTPYRASDHDPVVIGLSLGVALPVLPTKPGW